MYESGNSENVAASSNDEYSIFASHPTFHTIRCPATTRCSKPSKATNFRCSVCDDISSGKHYGVLACNGCSGFFKRSVRRKLIYRCQAATGGCLVDKAHRNQCQACRLKKCLQVGMNKDAVQNERQPRNSSMIGGKSIDIFKSVHALSSDIKTRVNQSNHAVTDSLITADAFSINWKIPEPASGKNQQELQDVSDRPDISSERIKQQQTVASDKIMGSSFSFYYSERLMPMEGIYEPMNESLFETSVRILFFSVRWAKNLPSFSNLSFRDQVVLLEGSWSELFLLSSIQWGLPWDHNPLFSNDEVLKSQEIKDSSVYTRELQFLQKTCSRFKELITDIAEFACLKAIVLFKPDQKSLREPRQIEALQDHAQLTLAHHIKSQHYDHTIRFGRLLLLLSSLSHISPEKVEAIYFSRNFGSTSMEKLLCDMFKY